MTHLFAVLLLIVSVMTVVSWFRPEGRRLFFRKLVTAIVCFITVIFVSTFVDGGDERACFLAYGLIALNGAQFGVHQPGRSKTMNAVLLASSFLLAGFYFVLPNFETVFDPVAERRVVLTSRARAHDVQLAVSGPITYTGPLSKWPDYYKIPEELREEVTPLLVITVPEKKPTWHSWFTYVFGVNAVTYELMVEPSADGAKFVYRKLRR